MACLCCLASCISLEEGFIPETGKNHTIEVMASVEGFDKFNVGTKAIEDDESKVSELTMIIYDSQGNIVGDKINLSGANSVFMIETLSKNNDPDAKPYIIYGTNKIDIQNAQEYLKDCTIYMIANSASVLYNDTMENNDDDPSVATITALKALTFPVTGISIPSEGFPMVGCQSNVNLSRTRGTNETTTKLDIPMKKLFAKINVSFQINATVIQTPRFQLTGWTVSNVPSKVSFVEPEYTETEDDKGNKTKVYDQETVCAEGSVLTTEPSIVLSAGKPTILHSPSLENPDRFQFTFYMPEQIVKPNKTIKYPTGIPNDEKQRYKPHLCESPKTPTYVTVTGIYTDLHGQVHDVTYSLYLGQNNTDNFEIYRNQQVNNIITIKGITNSHSGNCPESDPDQNDGFNYDFSNDNISADHRVDVAEKDFSIAIEREALLDSHFEVRPMDVFVSEGGKVVVTVNSDDTKTDDDWLRIEKPYGGKSENNSATNGTYIYEVGVRKYFTKDLLEATILNGGLSDSRSVTIEAGEDSRIWLYFDENPNHYDKTIPGSQMYRDISVTVDYFAKGNTTTEPTSSQIITFRQMNLWRVWTYKDQAKTQKHRYYDIEYHEEYLYNYASDDNYGKRDDGMAWGLDGEESVGLSEYYNAYYVDGNISDALATIFVRLSGLNPVYDFYLPRDFKTNLQKEHLTSHEYAGLKFTNQIAYRAGISENISDLILTADPSSAVEYCLNKNKRNNEGGLTITRSQRWNQAPTYNSNEVKWYLPSIDEIEDIVIGGYQDFDVFQDKYYWSSQPGYRIYDLYYTFIVSSSGNFFVDNPDYARATKVAFKNNAWGYVDSEDTVAEYSYHYYTISGNLSGPTRTENSEEDIKAGRGDGYQLRSKPHRIRCVRNSGTVNN